MQQVKREDMNAAGDRGQSADNGGQNTEATRTKQQILHKCTIVNANNNDNVINNNNS